MKLLKIGGVALCLIAMLFALAWLLTSFYKKDIIQAINEEVGRSFNGKLVLQDADVALWATFPNLSVRLEGVTLTPSVASSRPILSLRKIFVAIRTLPLLRGRIQFHSITFQDGEVFAFRSANGINNWSFDKSDSAKREEEAALVEWTNGVLDFRNVRLVYHDSLKQKFFSVRLDRLKNQLSFRDSLLRQHLVGNVFFEELTFHRERGSFLKGTNASVDFLLQSKGDKLLLDSSTLKLSNSLLHVRLSAHQQNTELLVLDISSDRLNFEEGLKALPATLASKLTSFSVDQPLSYSVHLEAKLGESVEPGITMKFAIDNAQVRYRQVVLEKASLAGTFTNHYDPQLSNSNTNTQIHFTSLAGELHQLPFTAEAKITDLTKLNFELDSRQKMDLSKLNQWVDSSKIKFDQGTLEAQFKYEGKLNEYLDTTATNYEGTLRGWLAVRKANFHWYPRKLDFEDVSAKFRFTQDTVWVDTIALATGKNRILLSGMLGNYVPFFLRPSEKAFVNLLVTSPSIDLATLLVKKNRTKLSANKQRIIRKRMSDIADQLIGRVDFQMALKIKELKNGAFRATNLSGELRWGKNRLEAKKLKMNFGGGKVESSLLVRDLQRAINPIEWKATCTNVDVRFLFKAFGNFGQKSVIDKNLEGTIGADVQLVTRVNDDFNFVPGSFAGPIRLTIRNGRIIELPAFQTLSSFLLNRRDFDNIKFAQIDGSVKIKGTELEIDRMEIQSSVLGLFLEGTYSLRNQTDLTIQIPLSNLKKRDKGFVPKNVGVDKKAGPSVFLTAKNDDSGKVVLSYDLLHKFRKKK